MMTNPGFRYFSVFVVAWAALNLMMGIAAGHVGTVKAIIQPGSYDIKSTAKGHEVFLKDFGRHLIPGKPDLPAQIFSIAIPPGSEVTDVTFESKGGIVLDGTYQIPPATLPRAISNEDSMCYKHDQMMYEANYKTVYGSNDPYPPAVGEFVRRAGYRKYNLVDVRINPFFWHPKSGRLIYQPEITIEVGYTFSEKIPEEGVLWDHLERTEVTAQKIVFNYDQAQAWYPTTGNSTSRGFYDFVIITLGSLVSSIQPLVDWETAKGRIVNVVTLDWIEENYTGYDLAEKQRNFLRDKYPSSEWGIEDVLLVGHYDDVPMRRCWQYPIAGKPETDYYYAELSKPDSQSWDKNQNHKWGEDSDPIDFYAEVNVGRIPWSHPSTVKRICDKSVAYEQNHDPAYKKNILLLAAFFAPDTDTAELMEYKTDTNLHPWMSDWTRIRMYEQGHSSHPMDYNLTYNNVRSIWSSGKYAFVNWAGHGSPDSCNIYYAGGPFVDTATCPYLNDDYPAIIFADACSNSDTSFDNIGQMMMQQGAVGFLGANKSAYGRGGWTHPNDGSSQSFDYYFTTSVTSGDYTLGEAHQRALRKMYTDGLWYQVKYEMFEWGSLWGNPDLRLGMTPGLNLKFPEGLPDGYYPPGPETVMTLEIKPGLENYVPGTGKLHYRFDSNDPYSTVPVSPLGNDLYQAVLPHTEPGSEPEFYFSAQGDGGYTAYSPYWAPNNVYSFEVCMMSLVIGDDFESDLGWTVESQSLQTGEWERADPHGTDAQPEDDHTEGGTHCYVTGKEGGSPDNDDVDGGPTRLISPTIDLSEGDAEISFYLWYYHTSYGTQQFLEIQLSSDNGSSWNPMAVVFHNNPDWILKSYIVSDYIDPTSQAKIRFSACDNPDDDIVEVLVDDFKVKHLNPTPSLWADAYSISAPMGAVVDFSLDAGMDNGSRSYLLIGTSSGTSPGFNLPGGQHMPINWDVFTDFVLSLINTSVFSSFLGTLDVSGTATAQLNAPPVPEFAGVTMHYAFALNNPWDFVSNPVAIEIVP